MKTTLDIEQLLYDFLHGSALESAINGGVYKLKRPVNSALEDVVLIALPAPNLQLQEAVVNVNIHVPNIETSQNGATDSLPDTLRLKQLATLAEELLRDTWAPGGDWHFELQQQRVFEDDDKRNHYINIRLDFYSINILN